MEKYFFYLTLIESDNITSKKPFYIGVNTTYC